MEKKWKETVNSPQWHWFSINFRPSFKIFPAIFLGYQLWYFIASSLASQSLYLSVHWAAFQTRVENIEQGQGMPNEESNASYSPFTTHHSPLTILISNKEQGMLNEE
ncbi:hypothetical protein [Foetidibacter luteolus]|uniref:hypothetical protein n=1 Tax=Foetidibacter luteolus TaxID=2608880 RepID=UPI00129A9C5E|nr:hypothetical protein [Foetidibacter luteolus]